MDGAIFTVPVEQAHGLGDEPPMFLQRPSSVKSQDVTHILARTFRELYTKEVVTSDTIQYLSTSRGGEDEFHERYVIALQKIKDEHDRRLAEAAMLERHILQAQARALTADERAADRMASSMKGYPDVCIPPARSHFRSCIDSELLRKHNLISPEDFSALKLPVVPPPRGPSTPHYAVDTRTRVDRRSKKGKEEERPRSDISDSIVDHRPAESELDFETKELNSENSPPAFQSKNLWKQQITNEERLMCRGELGNFQVKVDHLKNHHYLPPGDLLIKKNRKKCKEIGIKAPPESEDKALPVFIAVPAVITFKDYKVGQVYEIKLELKNVTTVLRPVRVIPPKTQYFSVGLGQFPGEHGLVAPGMSCIYAIRFSPDSLCDFDDVLQVETQSSVSPLLVPLQGRRPVPVLTVPEELKVGHCLVDGVKVGQFIVKNEGGPGRFCIMPASSWPSGNVKLNSSAPVVQVDPFEVQPAMFELKSNELMTLEVLFAPKQLDVFFQSLVIVCDNCHIQKLTITGESKNPEVELVSAEDYLSEYELGEMTDVTAQHLIRFPTLVPFIYLQETFTVRNCINVELAYNWVVVRPHHVVKGIEGDEDIPVAGPDERVQDVESAFSVEPDSGVLPAGGTVPFTLTFAPPAANQYNSILHLVLHYFLQSSTDETLDSRSNDQWATKSLMSSCLDPKLTDLTALEIEVKGICESYRVSVEPCVISIPGQILLETTLKKSFKVFNNSMASILFSWTNAQCSSYLLNVEPSFGEIMPHSELMLELSITGSEPGRIDHRLECHLSPVDEPITLHVMAEVKGPDLVVDQPDVNFGLVLMGSVVQSALTLRNFSRVPAKWQICEASGLPEQTEFQFHPPGGEIRPLDAAVVGISFCPKSCRSVHTVFEISLTDGFQSAIPVYGEVQCPAVCLRECQLNIPDAFLNVAVHRSVVLVNQTLFPTPFHWNQVQGKQANDCQLRIEPESGILQPRQQLEVDICFSSSRLGEYSGLLIPCTICGMAKPLCLELSAVVSGLSVSYSVSDHIDGRNRNYDNLVIDFGLENKLGSTPKRFLFLKNNSGINAVYHLGFEHYDAPVKPPTPPDKRLPHNSVPKRKLLLAKTPNLADPVPKTKEQVHADLCKSMLKRGKGAAFHAAPSAGVLGPFAEICLELTGFSDMWGTYMDQLLCLVTSLDVIYIPVTMTVTGCPLYFSMVNPKTDQKPILRFGSHVAGAWPVVRPTRIMNSSSVDLRLDWQIFNVCPNDNQLLDLVVCYGTPFPLKDDSGNEIQTSVVGPTSVQACYETTDEGVYQCMESDESFDLKRPKVISLTLRSHGGKEARRPFEIRPSQFVVPAFESKTVEVVFTPQTMDSLNGSSENIDCISYALAYISLNKKDQHKWKVLHRVHQYNISPLRVDMTAGIDLGLLSIMYEDDEDGLLFQSAASDLLTSDNQLMPLFNKVSSVTLCNRKTAPLMFRLMSPAPFAIVELDPVKKIGTKNINKTEQISLKPQQSARIHLAFCVTPDLLEYANLQSFFSCGRMPEGNEFNEFNSERKMKFQRELDIEFAHHAIQKIPMVATLVLPSLELSKDLVDFGTCLVGQTREIQITLTNRTTSDSQWSCTEEHTSHDDCTSIFEVTPNSGRLNAQITFSSNSKTLISIFFTAKAAEAYEIVYVFEGILGEQYRRLCVKGQGSHDGHFESLVNI